MQCAPQYHWTKSSDFANCLIWRFDIKSRHFEFSYAWHQENLLGWIVKSYQINQSKVSVHICTPLFPILLSSECWVEKSLINELEFVKAVQFTYYQVHRSSQKTHVLKAFAAIYGYENCPCHQQDAAASITAIFWDRKIGRLSSFVRTKLTPCEAN